MWNAWSDASEEGVFSNVYTSEPMPDNLKSLFAPGEPNGGTSENCLISKFEAEGGEEFRMSDVSCMDKSPAYCLLPTIPKLKMRGNNFSIEPFTIKVIKIVANFQGFDDNFDVWYTIDPMHLQAGKFIIYGFKDTLLFLDQQLQKWRMVRVTDEDVYALTGSADPPIGTHSFNKSEKAGGGTFWANINACDDERDFACRDGGCVPIEKRLS